MSCEDASEQRTPVTPMTAEEAARLIGVSTATLYRGARDGDVPCRRVGRRFVFVREVIVDWLLMREHADE